MTVTSSRPPTVLAGASPPSERRSARLLDRSLHVAEDLIYAVVALVLVAGAVVALVDAVHSLATEATDEPQTAVRHALDGLLIVFILVELLSAVRETVAEGRLLAEPFLLVGIIAAIKEIVVVTAFPEPGISVEDRMLEVGVLGAVVLALALATLVVRRKEREPEERTT